MLNWQEIHSYDRINSMDYKEEIISMEQSYFHKDWG